MAANMTAQRLSAAAAQIEIVAKESRSDDAPALIESLLLEFDALK